MDKYSVLCIDDEDLIRQNLSDFLEDNGFQVFQANNGVVGLEIFKSNKIDIILVDIRMPVMDGFEFIKRIREINQVVPIIVVSAIGLLEDVINALRLGGWDYISKPIDNMEIVIYSIKRALEKYNLIQENENIKNNLERLVKAKTNELWDVNNLLKEEIKRRIKAEEELRNLNTKLEEKIKLRTRELQESLKRLEETKDMLVQSEKLASLGVMVSGIAHEINTPIGVSVTAITYLKEKFNELIKTIAIDENNKHLINNILETINIIYNNLEKAISQINSFKSVAQDQVSEEKKIFNLYRYLNTIIDNIKPKLRKGQHKVYIECDKELNIYNYPGIFSQIFTNLIMNSIIHGFENKENGSIWIIVSVNNKEIKIVYKDNGIGIKDEIVDKIFDPFFTTKRGKGGSGLGMNIIYNLITKKLNGTIICNNKPFDGGVEFIITIPDNL